jgi:hypothetical protein
MVGVKRKSSSLPIRMAQLKLILRKIFPGALFFFAPSGKKPEAARDV